MSYILRWEDGIMNLFSKIKIWFLKQGYKEGAEISRFIACDVRRTINIISNEKIDDGLITICVKTNNLLYIYKKLAKESDYGHPVEIQVSDIWNWTGKDWGGLPDGTSLAERLLKNTTQQGDASEPDATKNH